MTKMEEDMKLLPAVACAAVLALTATASSAAVVCNDEGDCWRVKERPDYEPGLKLRVYDDDCAGATTVPGTAITAAVSG